MRRSKDTSSSNSSSSSSESSGGDLSPQVLDDRSKLRKLALVGPGVLAAESVRMMKQFIMQSSGQLWDGNEESLPALASQYSRQYLCSDEQGNHHTSVYTRPPAIGEGRGGGRCRGSKAEKPGAVPLGAELADQSEDGVNTNSGSLSDKSQRGGTCLEGSPARRQNQTGCFLVLGKGTTKRKRKRARKGKKHRKRKESWEGGFQENLLMPSLKKMRLLKKGRQRTKTLGLYQWLKQPRGSRDSWIRRFTQGDWELPLL